MEAEVKRMDKVFTYQGLNYFKLNTKNLHLFTNIDNILIWDNNNNKINPYKLLIDLKLNYNDDRDISIFINKHLDKLKFKVFHKVIPELILSNKFLYFCELNNMNIDIIKKILKKENQTQEEINDFDFLMDRINTWKEHFQIYNINLRCKNCKYIRGEALCSSIPNIKKYDDKRFLVIDEVLDCLEIVEKKV